MDERIDTGTPWLKVELIRSILVGEEILVAVPQGNMLLLLV